MKKPLLSQLLLLSLLSMSGTAARAASSADNPLERELSWVFIGIALSWILLIVIFVGVMIARFTLRQWPPDSPNPYAEQTMGMPPGVLRSILTLSLVVFILLIELYRFQYPADLDEFSKDLISGFEIMLGFYFGTKALQTLSNNDKATQEAAAKAMQDKGTPTNPLQDPSSEG